MSCSNQSYFSDQCLWRTFGNLSLERTRWIFAQSSFTMFVEAWHSPSIHDSQASFLPSTKHLPNLGHGFRKQLAFFTSTQFPPSSHLPARSVAGEMQFFGGQSTFVHFTLPSLQPHVLHFSFQVVLWSRSMWFRIQLSGFLSKKGKGKKKSKKINCVVYIVLRFTSQPLSFFKKRA